jgi:predicted nucleic acid-binding protein
MSIFVVDVSVAIKWFLPEIFQADAQRLQNAAHELHVPSLLDAEFANVLWKKVRSGQLSRAEADAALRQLSGLPITRHGIEALTAAAFDLAVTTQRTVYDSLYLTLALRLQGQLVTADQKFFNALAATQWASALCWIANVP